MKKDLDYAIYEDTDSVFLNFDKLIETNGLSEKWNKITDKDKVEIIKKFSAISCEIINDKIYNDTQLKSFNSIETEFKINYKVEKISKSSLFVAKKNYANFVLLNEGVYGEKIMIKGLPIIRSDTPTFFKFSLKEILKLILKRVSDKELKLTIKKYENEAFKLPVEELSGNIGINGIKKYITDDNISKKGAPYHLKGTANYQFILDKLNLTDKYPKIEEGVKSCVVYLKENQYGFETLTYIIWPKEVESIGIFPDKQKMIDKFFLKKVGYLLNPANKIELLNNNEVFDLFF